jgi:hypothetical protein
LQKTTQSLNDGDNNLHLSSSSPDLPQETTQTPAVDSNGDGLGLKPVASLHRANSLSSSDRERRAGRLAMRNDSLPLNSGSNDASRARGVLSSVSEEGDLSLHCEYFYWYGINFVK